MKKLILGFALTAVLAACSTTPPQPVQPSGPWTPVNKPATPKE
jgi:hypothetical protein